MKGTYLVKKSNYFIMNSSFDLSLEEQKIILTLASMVQPEDEDFKSYKFKIADFMKLLGVEDKSKYTEIPKITKELMKKVFEIQEGNVLIQTAWLSGAKYEKGSGYVELTFSSYLKPYMLQLKERFTQYQLSNILTMKSKYSPRIYEILKCNEFKKQEYIEFELVDLRKLLKSEYIYPRYNDFKRYIILQAQKELKWKTDICFDFEEIKTGRKVTSIKFYIHSNKKNNLNKANNEMAITVDFKDPEIMNGQVDFDMFQINKIKAMIQENISENDIQRLLEVSNGDIGRIQQSYEVAQNNKEVKNLVGFLIKAIHENWTLETVEKLNIKHNFKQRDDWDMDELGRLEREKLERELNYKEI